MENGLTNVAALHGGWAAWRQAGYPVEGKSVTAPTATAAAWVAAGGMPALGQAGAPVTILEFSDYQCPYCRQHAQRTLPRIIETYVDSGQVRYLFKDFPLDSHPNAQKAAEAARCAGTQGAYWAMHHHLYDDQKAWSKEEEALAIETFVGYARALELDADAFRTCLESGQFGEQVHLDRWEGEQAGVGGTPSFLINGQLLEGAQPFEAFQERIEGELSMRP